MTPTKVKYLLRLLLLITIFAPDVAKAQMQNDIQLTQYSMMPTYYNPAAVGETEYLRIRGGARLQWLGIENAPTSFLGYADMPVKIGKKKIGVGVGVNQESLGLFSNLGIDVQLSYSFKFLKGELSVGVEGGYFNQKFKGTEVILPGDDDYHQSTDEGIPTMDVTGNTFDIDAGILYRHPKFYLGISGRHLLQPKVRLDTEGSEVSETGGFETELTRTVYFIGGCNIPINNTLFELQPSFLVKTDFNNFTAELTAAALYKKFLRFGASYRWKDAVGVQIGANIKNFFIGYAYEYPLSAINKASSGSHELLAGYQLKLDLSGKNKNKHRSIRIM